MEKDNSITVVHLIWLPYGIELFRQFVESYVHFNAGAEHNLLLIFNGVAYETETAAYHDLIQTYNLDYASMYIKSGQDLDCYFKAAETLTTEYIVVLNSFSVILGENWLKKYLDHFSDPNTAVVSASGSCQSYYSSVFQKNKYYWESNKGFAYNFRKYKLFVKAFIYWRLLFKPFPNPHIRTNAFMIKRKLFINLQHRSFASKFLAYQFESGRNSMTNQLLKLGYKVLITDIQGKWYEPSGWKDSCTFWIENQQKLLVSDNQTRIYENADEIHKAEMRRLAWGS